MRVFEREGVSTPAGGKKWDRSFFPRCINDDVYKPHTYKEVVARVSPEVAAQLDPDKVYGLWCYNRLASKTPQVSEAGENGRRYKRQVKRTVKREEDWVYIPVPDSGIPREVVEAARERIKDNRTPSSAGRRFWELSGGIIHCDLCGRRMAHHSVLARNKRYHYHYYRCRSQGQVGEDCPQNKNVKAAQLEAEVWEFVSGLLLEPDRLVAGLEVVIDEEREALRGDPEREVKVWLDKIAETDTKRTRLQDMAAEGLITFEELRGRLTDLEETRAVAERNLADLKQRRERIESLEQDKSSLLESYANMIPEVLADLSGRDKHRIYQMLRLKLHVGLDEAADIQGALGDTLWQAERSRSCIRGATAGCSRGFGRTGP